MRSILKRLSRRHGTAVAYLTLFEVDCLTE